MYIVEVSELGSEPQVRSMGSGVGLAALVSCCVPLGNLLGFSEPLH